jgi:hypothetical protein
MTRRPPARRARLREAAGLIVIVRKPHAETTFDPTADTRGEAGDRLVPMGQVAAPRDVELNLGGASPLARGVLA